MKIILFLTLLNVSACEHYCLNYMDCDAEVKALQERVAELSKENRTLRLFSSYNKCDDVSTYHH